MILVQGARWSGRRAVVSFMEPLFGTMSTRDVKQTWTLSELCMVER